MSVQGETTYLAVSEALQDVFLRQRTVRLVCSTDSSAPSLFLLGGHLYLAGDNPWRARLEQVLTDPAVEGDNPLFDPHLYLASSLGAIVDGLGRDLAALGPGGLSFEEDLGNVPDDLVGPLPTAELVMDLAVRDRAEQELLIRLGGIEATLCAVDDPRMRLRVPYLDAGHLGLLERLATRTTIRTLLAEQGDGYVTTRRLVRLLSVGLIETASESVEEGVSHEVVQRLMGRVRADLAAQPLDLSAGEHRAEVARMLSEYAGLGYHELLGVDAGATPEEVHAAFMELARAAHPDHADGLGLGSSQRKMEWLWARLVEAYLVLSDPVRAAEHRRDVGGSETLGAHREGRTERRSEREALAHEAYVAALDFVEAEEFHYAIELLLQATRHAERPEYYSLLGHCQMQNPRWLRMAVDSFRRAVKLSPHDEELRGALAEATEVYRLHREQAQAAPEPAPREESVARRRMRLATEKLRSGWS